MVALCNDDVTDPATDVDMLGFKLDETEPVVEPVAGPVTEPFAESVADPLGCDELPHGFGYPTSRF